MRLAQRVFIWLGVALLACAGGTVAYAGLSQRYAARQFEREVAVPGATAAADRTPAPDLVEGDVIGRLQVPRVGISVMVMQGVEAATLVAGAGHVPGTPLPGADGNVAIAAHRDTFFRPLEGIRAGDRIDVTTVSGAYTYVVDSTEIVDPQNTEVIESRARSELTLITCYPFRFVGSAPNRFIVHASPARSATPSTTGPGRP